MDNEKNFSNPDWNDIFYNIGFQLKKRSGLLMRRVLIASSIGLIVLFFVNFGAELLRLGQFSPSSLDVFAPSVFLFGTIIVILTVAITIILMAQVKIEQVIWLDSYFDGQNLTPEESRKIAKKLFGAWAYLQFKIFYRYFLWIILSCLFIFFAWFYIFIKLDFSRFFTLGLQVISTIIIVVGGGLGLIFLVRYLKIKVSYAPFLFLDRYKGGGFIQSSGFWKEFFKELHQLNKISKGESFKKSVSMELGAEAAVQIVEHIARQIQAGFAAATQGLPSVAGAATRAASATVIRAGVEVAYRVITFAKITGRYVLYHFAFRTLYGKDREINEYIYGLKN